MGRTFDELFRWKLCSTPNIKMYVTNIKKMEQSVLSPLFAIQKITKEDPMTRNKM